MSEAGMHKTVRANITNLPYSLHDMYVTGLELGADTLLMRFDGGFVKLADPCRQVNGHIAFLGVDWDFSSAYVFNGCVSEGSFRGKKLTLHAFIKRYPKLSFEIVDENYGYNRSEFWGYLRAGRRLDECVVTVYHTGDMTYFEYEPEQP